MAAIQIRTTSRTISRTVPDEVKHSARGTTALSEMNNLVGEIKDRYRSWRTRARSRDEAAPTLEKVYETSPDVEFTALNPRSSSDEVPLHAFEDISVTWIQAHCTADVFGQGRKCYLDKQVTRVHAHGARMTGTTRERGYCDQEITLQNGVLSARCACETSPVPSAPLPSASSAGVQSLPARTLACKHVVAILLAYLHPDEAPDALNTLNTLPSVVARPPLVCPVTRQTLDPARPLYQCEQCGTSFSAEGWKFLQDADKGRCCACDTRNTIKIVG